MAHVGLLLGRELRERLLQIGKIEKRIIAKAVRSARTAQDHALGRAAKSCQRLPVACRGEHAHKTCTTVILRDVLKFAQQAGVVFCVRGIAGAPRELRRITRRVNSGRAAERVNLQARIVGDYDFAGSSAAVVLGLLAGIGLKCPAIFDYRRQGREGRQRAYFDLELLRRSREIAQLSGVGSGNENSAVFWHSQTAIRRGKIAGAHRRF